jgi:hypothetical protein
MCVCARVCGVNYQCCLWGLWLSVGVSILQTIRIYLLCGFCWGTYFANKTNKDLRYMKDLAKVNNTFVWSVKVECMFLWSQCGVWCLLYNCLGCKIFHFVDANVLNEIQCNINFLRDLQCVIAWNVFAFFYEIKKCILCILPIFMCPLRLNSRQLVDYAINIFYGINDSNLLDFFLSPISYNSMVIYLTTLIIKR